MTMKTTIFKVATEAWDPTVAEALARILRQDGILVYPTETFYGLGALAFSVGAVAKIYRLKERDRGKPLSIVVADPSMAARVAASPPPLFQTLTAAFWPGPLTLIVRAQPLFPPQMLGPGGTVAMRVPGLPWLCRLLGYLGVPLTATSANLSGRGEISEPAAVIAEFDGKADVIVDAGSTPGGLPSTIVDLAADPPRIIRAGALPAAAVQRYLR
jgi:L-threonylcarbamoyladenylate synthase